MNSATRDYKVNGQSFGDHFGDANYAAMRRAIETGTRQSVMEGAQVIVAYDRGPSGLARRCD